MRLNLVDYSVVGSRLRVLFVAQAGGNVTLCCQPYLFHEVIGLRVSRLAFYVIITSILRLLVQIVYIDISYS